MPIIYLGDDPKKHLWETEEVKIGKRKQPVKGVLSSQRSPWVTGA